MSTPTGAFVMKDSSVEIDGVNYENQMTRGRLVPDTPISTKRTLVPDGIVQDVDSPAWTFEIAALQINDAGGLAEALRTAEPGAELDVVYAPKNEVGEAEATFTILALPVVFGGDQGSFADFEGAFPVVGQPLFGTVSS